MLLPYDRYVDAIKEIYYILNVSASQEQFHKEGKGRFCPHFYFFSRLCHSLSLPSAIHSRFLLKRIFLLRLALLLPSL
ncbi:hypothetical protein RchiOBHm_Chr5g0045441 [Rosa chinensis]|uniref:Uncharacterized protein n=1 Tax=Rosa chinensis TaxID=74649 RepID=A0A2P6QDW2_ROSCH|nr:hypothetical protein RchiOBHm_Chr5g0045441 [Rosa chinensis]